MKQIRFGTIHADYITMGGALDVIEKLATEGTGGYVVTPNVDHVVMSEKNHGLRQAYAEASLSLVDGMPLKWLSTLVGDPLPEKISGSDLIKPLLRRAAQRGLRVYFLGAAPGVARIAADRLMADIPGLNIVGVDSPPVGFEKNPTHENEAVEKMVAASPHLVFMALGCPKQELLMHRWNKKYGGMVYLGIGASLDFIAGKVKRCPPWMSELGIEWVYRISQDPKRLVYRYLIRDAAILPIVYEMLKKPRHKIVTEK